MGDARLKRLLRAAAAAFGVGLTLVVCGVASASCLDGVYDEPLPVTAVAPSDGASIQASPTLPIMFSMISPAPPMDGLDALFVTVTTQDIMGNTGILSDLNEVDAVGLPESSTNWGVYRGVSNVGPTLWTNIPGTYYWQAFGMFSYYDQAAGQIVCDARASPVYTITIAASPPTPPNGSGAEPPSREPPARSPAQKAQRLTLPVVRVYGREMVHRRTREHPRLRLNCYRINAHTFHCALAWAARGYTYAAAGRFWNYLAINGRTYGWYDFRGTRTSRSCEAAHPRARRCTVPFHWR